MFEASLNLPRDPKEADVIADSLAALATALRDWPLEAWTKVNQDEAAPHAGLFERLVARTAPAALEPRARTQALHSAEAVADVLRVLWPEHRPAAQRALAMSSN
jgi:hypothetical protein